MSAGEQGLRHWAALFGKPVSRFEVSGRLDKGSLPTPVAYLSQQGLLAGKVRGEWASIRCPSHKGGDEAHPSMRVSLADGHFKCHACGAKGGDVIALHRIVT